MPPTLARAIRHPALVALSAALCTTGILLSLADLLPSLQSWRQQFGTLPDQGHWLTLLGAPGLLVGLRSKPAWPPGDAETAGNPPPAAHNDPDELKHALAHVQQLIQGDFSAPPPLPIASPLLEAIDRLRQQCLAAVAGSATPAPAGDWAKLSGQLRQLVQEQHANAALAAVLGQVVQNGEFELDPAEHGLTQSPAGRACHALLSQQAMALGDIGRLASALACGRLSEQIEHVYPGKLGHACAQLNATVVSLRETLGRIDAVVDTVSSAAREIADGNDALASRTQSQAASLEETASSMEEINAVVQQNAQTADRVMQFVTQATEMSRGATATMDATRQTMRDLTESARRIESIVGVIDGLAFQTNLLALNAAVEAARAGEHGKGFAVVASEVRTLSQRSSESAQDIRRLIAGTVSHTGESIRSVESLSDTMRHLIETIRQINDNMRDIQTASQEQASGLAQVSEAIMRIDDATQQTSTQVDGAASATRQLYGQARGLHNLLQEFDLGAAGETARRIHQQMPERVQDAAQRVGQLWEKAIARGLLSIEELFDQEYLPFGDTEPPKYHTRFDAVADRILPRLQEQFANEAPYLAYAIACDHNGYVPTHNQRYCEALTGDPAYDKVHNRTKRIFSDPVGVRCGRHPLPYLLQTYRRDTGEIMHDISAPIYVQGRHWGGFRIGYKTVLA